MICCALWIAKSSSGSGRPGTRSVLRTGEGGRSVRTTFTNSCRARDRSFTYLMCGIAGYYLRSKSAHVRDIQNMCAEIRHRGPDDEGHRVDGRMGMGMRRLSVIDRVTGRQPISNEDGTVWVVSNGEIYNYRELRASLVRNGHDFRTRSDTEVLVHLWEDEGVGAFERLRGMFASAIWDARERSLVLARDRFGKKPLYYADDDDGLYFASELKCLRAAGLALDHDREALQLYFLLGYIPDPWTAYRAIRKLPAGSWLRCDAAGRIQ